MKVEHANAISMIEILKILGCVPVKKNGLQYWYNSPLRPDDQASFHVDGSRNMWQDFGIAKSGKVIDFVCDYLKAQAEDHTVADALRWVYNMQPSDDIEALKDQAFCEQSLILCEVGGIRNEVLTRYLKSRGIPLNLAKEYLKEAFVHNCSTGKKFHALALPNESGGFALKNKVFKGSIAPKGITLIRGKWHAQDSNLMPTEVHVFENVMDFLSALIYQEGNKFHGDAIILNSLSNLSMAFPYIKGYTYRILYSWFDNDPAGQKAGEMLNAFTARQDKLKFKSMNRFYAAHKDVSAWHKHKLGK